MVDGKQQWKAWLFLAPALLLMLVFTVWPIINTVAMAFINDYKPGLENSADFKGWTVGIDNFVNLFDDVNKNFLNCLKNTLILCVVTVPISTMLALLIAVALNSIKPLQKVFQTIFFLPYVTNTIAIGMVFAVMFDYVGTSTVQEAESVGVINSIIQFFGGEPLNWLGRGEIDGVPFSGYVVVCLYIIWNALPFKILVLLGGLQGINKQYYEAAKVDGTSRGRIFWRITVPLLSPMLVYVIITSFIGGFKEYNSVVGIFDENMAAPGVPKSNSMNTMVGLIYDSINTGQQYGRASAAALILFAIILVVTLINLQISKKRTHY